MLAVVLRITITVHYCGGKENGRTISFTTGLTDCGMKDLNKEIPFYPGSNFTEHCCKDLVAVCGVDNYYSSSFSFVPEYFRYDFQILTIPIKLSANSQTNINLLYTNVSPPGVLMSTNVDLDDICVFRI
jgi:hypothetical protein